MRILKCVCIALVTLPLLGCPMRPSYVGQPNVKSADGLYTHPPSGMVFPTEVGSFRRDVVRRYDTEGLDVSAGYNLISSSALVVATVYVYPAPPIVSIGSPPEVVAAARAMASGREFELRKREILGSHAGARVTEEGECALQQGGLVHSGRRAVFSFKDVFGGQHQILRSELYLFSSVDGKWIVKYRFTYPRSSDVSKHLERFMRGVPWTAARS